MLDITDLDVVDDTEVDESLNANDDYDEELIVASEDVLDKALFDEFVDEYPDEETHLRKSVDAALENLRILGNKIRTQGIVSRKDIVELNSVADRVGVNYDDVSYADPRRYTVIPSRTGLESAIKLATEYLPEKLVKLTNG